MTTVDQTSMRDAAEDEVEPFSLLHRPDRGLLRPDLVDAYPLADVQAAIVDDPDGADEVEIDGRRVTGPYDPGRLRAAADDLTRRHELLRTSIDPTTCREPVHLVHAEARIPVAEHDHRGLAEAQRPAAFAALLDADRANPFDPGDAPLLRLAVVQETDESWILTVSAPRVVSVTVDLAAVLAGLLCAYRQTGGEPAGHRVVRHAPCVATELDGPADYDGELFWQQLAGQPPFALPTGLGGGPGEPGGGPGENAATVDFADLAGKLEAIAVQAAVGLPTVLLAAHLKVLTMLTTEPVMQTEVAYGPGHRPDLDGDDCELLLHRRVLPFPATTPAPTWRDLVARTGRDEQSVWTHRHAHRPETGTGDERLLHALFEVCPPHAGDQHPGTGLPVRAGTAPGLRVTACGDQLRLVTATAALSPEHTGRIAAMYRSVLAAIAADPDGDARAAYLPPDERERVLGGWSDGPAVDRGATGVVDLILAQAQATPDAPAVRTAEDRLTFAELVERSSQLAHHLRELGAMRDTLVGVCLGRTADLVPALLGVWQTGAGYLPLDPELPPERLRHMLDSTGCALVVSDSSRLATLTELYRGTVVLTDRDADAIAARPATPVGVPIHPAQLAYVIYTSGSTGVPKGVMVPHGGLVNYLLWTVDAYAAHGRGGAPVFSSISFDLGIPDIFTPLITGEPVHLLPEPFDTADLGAHLAGGAPYSFIKMTPGHLDLLTYQLTAEQARDLAGIVIAAGDSFTADLAARWLELAGPDGTKVATEYGPTEITIGNSGQPIGERPATELVPLGVPIQNTTMYVLTDRLEPAPVGVPGEVYIGGVGVARGYLGRPDLTADRFVPDPYGAPGARLYRSGDLARWLPDGSLEFLGRMDNQVKIRGYRVELGEIQAQLIAHPHVRDAVVVARDSATGDKRLVGYVVLVAGQTLDAAVLRDHLAAALPEYMIPAGFVAIGRIPLTTNGKVDSRALPALL